NISFFLILSFSYELDKIVPWKRQTHTPTVFPRAKIAKFVIFIVMLAIINVRLTPYVHPFSPIFINNTHYFSKKSIKDFY
ncbi:MAG: hypothetical protein J6X12_13015, partial [Paludibacteraceae bacterium]|nr:hypothetical protein [Paludibacteraceae bacterium]